MADKLPGAGLWGWLGRQLGYVSKAVKADVTQEVVHREERVQEATLPDRPEVKLRRTVIDEVIVKKLPLPEDDARSTDTRGQS
jgi:hypothetical protein